MNAYRPVSNLPLWFFDGLDLPQVDYDSLVWENIRGGTLLDDEIYSKRDRAPSFNNEDKPEIPQIRKVIRDLLKNLESDSDCETLYRDWPINTWKIDDNFIFDIKRDLPDFNMGVHLDNRNIKWTLIINLEDNTTSTKFHLPGKQEFTGPTKRGSGLFYFNNHELYHSIEVTDLRYIIFYMNVIG